MIASVEPALEWFAGVQVEDEGDVATGVTLGRHRDKRFAVVVAVAAVVVHCIFNVIAVVVFSV